MDRWSFSGLPSTGAPPIVPGLGSAPAIRNADYGAMDGYRPHLPTGLDPFETLGVVDVGDVYVRPGELEISIGRIADAVEQVSAAGRCPSSSVVTTPSPGPTPSGWPECTGSARSP